MYRRLEDVTTTAPPSSLVCSITRPPTEISPVLDFPGFLINLVVGRPEVANISTIAESNRDAGVVITPRPGVANINPPTKNN